MRTLFIGIISLFISLSAFAQDTAIKTATITVKGNCEECKARIENAADIKGVKICQWNPETKVAKITYDTAKVSLLQIEEAIAASGYDAGNVKGNDKSYKKLPGCCKYRDGKCDEPKK